MRHERSASTERCGPLAERRREVAHRGTPMRHFHCPSVFVVRLVVIFHRDPAHLGVPLMGSHPRSLPTPETVRRTALCIAACPLVTCVVIHYHCIPGNLWSFHFYILRVVPTYVPVPLSESIFPLIHTPWRQPKTNQQCSHANVAGDH